MFVYHGSSATYSYSKQHVIQSPPVFTPRSKFEELARMRASRRRAGTNRAIQHTYNACSSDDRGRPTNTGTHKQQTHTSPLTTPTPENQTEHTNGLPNTAVQACTSQGALTAVLTCLRSSSEIPSWRSSSFSRACTLTAWCSVCRASSRRLESTRLAPSAR